MEKNGYITKPRYNEHIFPLALRYVRVSQLSNQAFSSPSLDLASNVMSLNGIPGDVMTFPALSRVNGRRTPTRPELPLCYLLHTAVGCSELEE